MKLSANDGKRLSEAGMFKKVIHKINDTCTLILKTTFQKKEKKKQKTEVKNVQIWNICTKIKTISPVKNEAGERREDIRQLVT